MNVQIVEHVMVNSQMIFRNMKKQLGLNQDVVVIAMGHGLMRHMDQSI